MNKPATLYTDFDQFERDGIHGAYMFTHNEHGIITGMLNRCVGCGRILPINFNPAAGHPLWTLQCKEPITISPSVHHNTPDCGWHGWLKNGVWQDA